MSEEAIVVIACCSLGVLLLGLGVQSLLRQHRRPARERLACRRCESPDVSRLPPNEITHHPGFACENCGLRMRPRGSTYLYVVVLVVSVALVVLFTLPLWTGEGGGIAIFPFMLVVAGYAVRELLRPTPIRRPVDEE